LRRLIGHQSTWLRRQPQSTSRPSSHDVPR
jgi:hypothetical protein